MSHAPARPLERRHPERHRHTMWLLRRLAALCLVAAVGLVVLPPFLSRLGIIGPDAAEMVANAARAVEAARTYGARSDLAAYAQALQELQGARHALEQGHRHDARRAAERATERAIEAQKLAIAHGQDSRRQAESIVEELDRRVEELEDLYDHVTTGLPKNEVADLLSLMKNAREAAATLNLAYQDGNYAKVLAEEKAALGVLDAVKARLVGSAPVGVNPPGAH